MVYMQYFTSYSLVEILLPCFPVKGTGLWDNYTISYVSQLVTSGAEIYVGSVRVSFTEFVRQYAYSGKILLLKLSCELLPCHHSHWVTGSSCAPSHSFCLPRVPCSLLSLSLCPNTRQKQYKDWELCFCSCCQGIQPTVGEEAERLQWCCPRHRFMQWGFSTA